jgi:hypothetical protein
VCGVRVPDRGTRHARVAPDPEVPEVPSPCLAAVAGNPSHGDETRPPAMPVRALRRVTPPRRSFAHTFDHTNERSSVKACRTIRLSAAGGSVVRRRSINPLVRGFFRHARARGSMPEGGGLHGGRPGGRTPGSSPPAARGLVAASVRGHVATATEGEQLTVETSDGFLLRPRPRAAFPPGLKALSGRQRHVTPYRVSPFLQGTRPGGPSETGSQTFPLARGQVRDPPMNRAAARRRVIP